MSNDGRDTPARDVWRDLSTRTVLLHQAVADRLGLNLSDHKCLDLIVRTGPMTAGELARASGLTTGAITGIVDRLEANRFARRRADPKDRRKTVIEMLPDRRDEIEALFETLGQETARLMARYRPEEQAVIADFAARMNELVAAFAERLRSSPPEGGSAR